MGDLKSWRANDKFVEAFLKSPKASSETHEKEEASSSSAKPYTLIHFKDLQRSQSAQTIKAVWVSMPIFTCPENPPLTRPGPLLHQRVPLPPRLPIENSYQFRDFLRLCLAPESTKERKKILRKMIFSCLVVL